MAFVITQSCCADASCVSVCPVNCIHPTPDEPDYGHVDTLYVDPQVCIDCGACADACPVSAVRPAETLRGPEREFIDINARYYDTPRDESVWEAPWFTHAEHPAPAEAGAEDAATAGDSGLRIAIVGTGPSASYAARHLLTTTDATLTMFEREPVPGGLLRPRCRAGPPGHQGHAGQPSGGSICTPGRRCTSVSRSVGISTTRSFSTTTTR